jgi:hypothetical protein
MSANKEKMMMLVMNIVFIQQTNLPLLVKINNQLTSKNIKL